MSSTQQRDKEPVQQGEMSNSEKKSPRSSADKGKGSRPKTPGKEHSSTESKEDAAHWRILRHSKSPGTQGSVNKVTENLHPPTKQIRIELEKLDPGSPPLTQSIYNDSGDLIGTRTFAKFVDGYKQTDSTFSPKQTSSLSKLISPFSRERRKDEWDPVNTSSKKTDVGKTNKPTQDQPTTDSSEADSSNWNLHFEASQSSNDTDSCRSPDESKTVSSPTKSTEIADQAEKQKPASTDSEEIQIELDQAPSLISPLSETSNSPSDAELRSEPRKHTPRKLASKIKEEVRHLDTINEIMCSAEKMSNSQMITILDKNNLKPDLMNCGADTFYNSVMKQMHIAGIASDVHSVAEFRQMIAQHITYEDNYYKLVADSFLTSCNKTLEQCCDNIEKMGNPVTALDVFATARAINCHLHLFGVNQSWSNDDLAISLTHRTVFVSLIMHSPGEFCSTQQNIGRLSKRKSIKEVLDLTKTPTSGRKIGRMTLDLLSAPPCSEAQPSTSCQPVSYKGDSDKSLKDSNIPTADQIKGMATAKRSITKSLDSAHKSPYTMPQQDSNPPDDSSSTKKKRKKLESDESSDDESTICDRVTRSEAAKSRAQDIPRQSPRNNSSPKVKMSKTVQKKKYSSKQLTKRQSRNQDTSVETNNGQRCSPRFSSKSNTVTLRPRVKVMSTQTSSLRSPATTKKANGNQAATPRRPGVSPVSSLRPSNPCKSSSMKATTSNDSSIVPTPTCPPIPSASNSSSSDETDFSSINIAKLSPQDTKYFFNRAVTVIGKLKNQVRQMKGRKAKQGESKFTPTGELISSPRPVSSTSILPNASTRSRSASKTPSSQHFSTGTSSGTQQEKASNSDNDSSCSWYQCRTCHRIFSTKAKLAEHKEKEHEKRYPRNQCSRSFSHLSSLCTHRLVHENKVFKCHKCGKTFVRKDRLRAHILSHDGEFQYLCTKCGKGFQRKANFDAHMLVHAKIRPHKCLKCGDSFYYRQDYVRHTNETCSSNNQPKVKCETCGKMFKTDRYLKNHMKKHTGFEKFRCSNCGKIFVSSYGFKLHSKRCMNEKHK